MTWLLRAGDEDAELEQWLKRSGSPIYERMKADLFNARFRSNQVEAAPRGETAAETRECRMSLGVAFSPEAPSTSR